VLEIAARSEVIVPERVVAGEAVRWRRAGRGERDAARCCELFGVKKERGKGKRTSGFECHLTSSMQGSADVLRTIAG
jgi:hypothetical protein